MDNTYQVLIFDDDVALAEMLREFLVLTCSATVTLVHIEDDFWPLVRSGTFDILFLDYQLQTITGLEVLSQLTDEACPTPTVMMTGQGSEIIAARAIQNGAMDYLVKGDFSFSLNVLPTLVQKAVQLRRLRQSIRESEAKIHYQALLLENMRDALVVWDARGAISYWNAAAEQLYGLSAAEVLGRPVQAAYFALFTPPIDLPETMGRSGAKLNLEHSCQPSPNRQPVWISAQISALYDANSQVSGYMDISRDISARKQMEKRLHTRLASEKLLATLSTDFINLPIDNPADCLHDALAAVSEFLGIDSAAIYLSQLGLLCQSASCSSPSAEGQPPLPETLALDSTHSSALWARLQRKSLLHLPSAEALSDTERAEYQQLFGQPFRSAVIIPLLYNEEMMGLLLFRGLAAPFEWDEEFSYLALTFKQILLKAILQGQVDRALQKSEARYRAIVEEHQTEMICRFNSSGLLTFVNEAYCRYYHRNHAVLIGKSFFAFIRPEDHAHVQAVLAGISSDDPVSVSIHRVSLPGDFIRWQEWVIRGIGGEDEAFTEFQAVGRDITERKMMEEQIQSAQMRLAQATRLASVGQLAASVAHQISNPLTTIIADGQMLLRSHQPEDPGYDSAEAIVQAGWRAQRVIEELMKFSQPSEEKHELVYINESIAKALLLSTAHLHAAGTVIENNLPPVSPEVHGNSRQLTDLWLNLLLAPMTLESRIPQAIQIYASERDGTMTVRIVDLGMQLPSEQLETLFEPQLIPAGGKGTGIEMSICREIVRQHSGEIFVSCDDQSTTFEVSLPKGNAA